jgi:hypothetical protein
MKKLFALFFVCAIVSLHAYSQCSTATGFSSSNLKPYSADINYPSYAANDLIEYAIGNFTPGSNHTAGQNGQIVNIGSATTTLPSLNGGTTYTYYIRKYCGNNVWSANSSVGTFTTLPCPLTTFQGFGSTHTMSFSGRGYTDSYNSYNTACGGGSYGPLYGKENMIQFPESQPSYIINVQYNNPTGHPVSFNFRNIETLGWCESQAMNCKDYVTLSSGSTVKSYSINVNPMPIYILLMFDVDDSATYTSNGPSVNVSVSVACGDPGTVNASASAVCLGSQVTFSASGGNVPQGSTYNWYKGNCGQTWVGSGSSITVTPNATTSYYARLEGPCGISPCASQTITVNTNPIADITKTYCAPGVVSLLTAYNTVPSYTFQWRKDGVAIAGATGVTYVPVATGNYDVLVSNLCGTSTSSLTLVSAFGSPAVPVITYPYLLPQYCPGSTIPLSVTFVSGQTYQWKFNGSPITGATTTTYNAGVQGFYSCTVTNNCGTSTSSSIAVDAAVIPVLSVGNSPTTFCTGGSVMINLNMSTTHPHSWNRDGVVISGATDGFYVATQSGVYTWTYSAYCGTITSNGITVTVTNAPTATITAGGPTTFCTPGSVTLTANTGTGFTYQWKRDNVNIAGASLSTYAAASAGAYVCVITSACGSATSNVIAVTTLAGAPTATINPAGPTSFCNPGSVSLVGNTGTGLTYQWKANGTSISGATSSSYLATTAGSYTCVISNTCGSTTSNAVVVTVTSPASTAGAITGQSSGVCSSSKSYSVVAIANATSYAWTAPPGSSITSGQGTTSVIVAFTSSFTSGNISVAGTNACGSGTASSLSVIAIPAQPASITGPVSVCHNQNNVVYSTATVAGAASYTWTVPPGTNIKSGQGTTQIKVRFGNSAGAITVKANNSCGSGAVRSVSIAMPCRDVDQDNYGEEDEILNVSVYPNPSSVDFTFDLSSLSDEQVTITIFDLTGRQLETHKVTDKYFQCGENLRTGIYFAEIIFGENRKLVRLIKE